MKNLPGGTREIGSGGKRDDEKNEKGGEGIFPYVAIPSPSPNMSVSLSHVSDPPTITDESLRNGLRANQTGRI